MQITETRVFSRSISSVGEVGKWRVVFLPNQEVYYCPADKAPERLGGYKATTIANMANGKILAINDATILVKQDKRLTKVTISDSGTDEGDFHQHLARGSRTYQRAENRHRLFGKLLRCQILLHL